jgi:hypothetical protein
MGPQLWEMVARELGRLVRPALADCAASSRSLSTSSILLGMKSCSFFRHLTSDRRARSEAPLRKICNPKARSKFPGSRHKKAMASPLINWFPPLGGYPRMRFARPIAMHDQFPVFEKVLKKRSRTWRWRVCTTEGDVVMQGSESSRPAAKYKADRALFLLLLSAPYRSIRLRTLPEP